MGAGLLAPCGAEHGRRIAHDYLMSRFSDAARKLLEETVKLDDYEWKSEFALSHIAKGKAEGKAEGEAKSVLLVLDARGISVPNNIRDRVTACTGTDRRAPLGAPDGTIWRPYLSRGRSGNLWFRA